jgi:cytochrome oxidase Cu insertion factor (SCO1/SenC/PrrC family)
MSTPAEGQAEERPEVPEPPRLRGRRRAIIALLCAVALVTGLFSYLLVRHRQQDSLAAIRPSGIPASISTPLAVMMGLSPVPVRAAPGFTLTDQDGRVLSLASFRGRAVVLEFMDPHCSDICPIVSQEFARAYRDLGAATAHAVFVAVNVNRYHHDVSDVAAYSSEQQLSAIPSWHFFTGKVPSLQAVWRAYDISVNAPGPNADVIHTSEVLFIDPQGQERYIADPMADYTSAGKAYLPAGQLAQWGQGIALVTRQLTH